LSQQQQTVDTLSVGWKMRVILAKLLLQKADFYLFDEPTNHLDITTKEWFLSFLQEANFGFLLVTHDRHFLEKACTTIFELERGKGTMYYGNFSFYIEQKEQRQAALITAHNRQQRDIERKQATIDRFKASASKAKMAQSMIKKIEKMEIIEIEPTLPTVSFQFPPTERAGRVVLTLKDISYAFGAKKLFSNASCEILRGQKVALVAPNGTGKTTLFNVITGKLPLQQGSIEFGYNVKTAFFEQEQARVLNPDNTILEEVTNACSNISDSVIRSFLGSFLFHGDDIYKKIKVLSGGEKNRVAMLKVLLQKANFLLLDEPTNHLDLYSKEVLLQALQQYDGTMLFVSHDHTFIQNLATGILELTQHGLHYYPGTLEEFLDDKKRKQAVVPQKNSVVHSETLPIIQQDNKLMAKKIKQLEATISRLEHKEQKLMNKLEAVEYGTTQYRDLMHKIEITQKELAASMQEWEKTVAMQSHK
jgi:ATP-binding cassette subfamily F protein 3